MPATFKPLVEEVEPKFEWVKTEECDTLLVHLHGYMKENLKVQVTISRKLRVLGERKEKDGKLSRFQKEFSLPEDCDADGITAKFETGVLKIMLPKMKGSALRKEEHSVAAAAATGTGDEKPREKADEALANAQESGKLNEKIETDQKEAEGHGNEEKPATEEKCKKKFEGRSRVKKATLLAVMIVGVGVALGIRLLQSKGSIGQTVNDMRMVTMNPQQNVSNVSCIC